MNKQAHRPMVALASLTVCLTMAGCVLPATQASSEQVKPVPVTAALTATRLDASPSAMAMEAVGQPKKTVTSTKSSTTSTTVMGGGSPSTWPAAKKVAPSLAGAYSTNPTTAFLALVRYSDWVASHPEPGLVRNYVLPTSNIYRNQVYQMQQMVRRGWHVSPQPTQIDFLKTVLSPVTKTLPDGRKYQGDAIETVINEVKYPYLNRLGKAVGHTTGGGPTAYVVTLVQESLHTQFYIDLWEQVTSAGGGLAWEHEIQAPK